MKYCQEMNLRQLYACVSISIWIGSKSCEQTKLGRLHARVNTPTFHVIRLMNVHLMSSVFKQLAQQKGEAKIEMKCCC